MTRILNNPAQVKLLVVLINQWLPRFPTLLLLIDPKMRNLLFQLRFQESILAHVRLGQPDLNSLYLECLLHSDELTFRSPALLIACRPPEHRIRIEKQMNS
jgi:hypothetical protein